MTKYYDDEVFYKVTFDGDGATETISHEYIDEFKYLQCILQTERIKKHAINEFFIMSFALKLFPK